jgi:gas vesicle protein
MHKIDHLAPFLAGLGLGVAASVLLAPEAGGKTRGRIRDIASRAGDGLKAGAEHVGDAAEDVLEKCRLTWRDEQNERSKTMSDMKDKAKEIDDAADAARKAAGQVIDKSKDVCP